MPKSVDHGDMYTDRKGRCYCSAHRRENCHICCVDHRVTNQISQAGPEADIDAILQRHEELQDAEHRAMLTQRVVEGSADGPLMLGSEEAQRLYSQAADRPPSGAEVCAVCKRGGKLKRCARCKFVRYCSREHQVADYQRHKADCRRIAAAVGGPSPAAAGSDSAVDAPSNQAPRSHAPTPITWAALEDLEGMPATGQTLKLRIMSQPIPFMRWACECKDRKGDVRRLAFYLDNGTEAPAGLALGKVLRWRNPHFHCFMDGSTGARIEDEDLPNVSVSDS